MLLIDLSLDFSAFSGSLIASGGLDSVCSIYRLPNTPVSSKSETNKEFISEIHKPFKELCKHEGYVSCCRFIHDDEIITSSGDGTCILWDVEMNVAKQRFRAHHGMRFLSFSSFLFL
jgi:guanine nucleotide-binding protein G(I)/G(S)/G(T) subunit beta-1